MHALRIFVQHDTHGCMRLTVKHIVSEWPSVAEFARDISSGGDAVPDGRVRRWRDRNSIPAKYFAAMLDAAKSRGIELTAEDLISIHDERERNEK